MLSRYQNAAEASREYAERFPEGDHPGPRLNFKNTLYTSDLPPTNSRKFIYADDLAMAYQHHPIFYKNHLLYRVFENY
jgi:hypothetical protein